MEAALIGFAVMLLICFMGVPLGFAMIPVGFVGFAAFRGLDPALAMVGQVIMENHQLRLRRGAAVRADG